MAERVVVIGGTRSGKSAVAEGLVAGAGAVVYVATATASDAEMAERIAAHRRRRPAGWKTVETCDLAGALAAAPPGAALLVDALGPWVAERMGAHGLWPPDGVAVAPLGAGGRGRSAALVAEAEGFWTAAAARDGGPVVVVAEDAGVGLVPADPGTRRWLDLAGAVLQRLSAAADRVLLVVAGRPVELPCSPLPGAPSPAGGGDLAAPPPRAAAPPAGGELAAPLPRAAASLAGGTGELAASSLPAAASPAGGTGELAASPPRAAASAAGGTGELAAPPSRAAAPPAGRTGAAPSAGAAPPSDSDDLRAHGDRMVPAGALDFAVNVHGPGPPPHVGAAIDAALAGVAAYPDERPAVAAVAARHGRAPAEVLLTAGAADAFWLLARVLGAHHAAVVHPTFTEPEAALRAAGVAVERVLRRGEDGWPLDPAAVPDDADVVVVGNPNNPTGTLDDPEAVAALCRPGRVTVVDEAFMNFVPDEDAASLAARGDLPGLVVVRSVTKLWGLAGLRAGYLLAPSGLVRRCRAQRQPWPLGSAALAALRACLADDAWRRATAEGVAQTRKRLAADLAALPGLRVWDGAANFLLLRVPDGPAVDAALRRRGVAVRPSTFPGLDRDHLRVAVRAPQDNARLVAALRTVLDDLGVADRRP